MKQMLALIALCLTVIASCMKEQTKPKTLDAETVSKATFTDDFYLSRNVKPFFRRIDSARTIVVFADSVYNNFGGSLRHIEFQFSNPDIDYRHLKLIIASTSGQQYVTYNASTTTTKNGSKVLVIDNQETGLLISPGWSTIVLKAKVLGKKGDRFNVTIPQGCITYYSINQLPGTVVGLPISTEGLKIR